MTNEIAHPCQHGNEAILCLQCHRDEIERLNGYVEHLVADREKQALAMTGEIERLKAELDQRNAEFREYARKTELEFRRLREALDRIAHPAAEWMNISEAAAIARDALKAPTPEPSVHPDPSEEAAEIARGFAKLREALIQAGWTPPDPDEHPFAPEFRRLMRGTQPPLLPSNEEFCAAGLTVIAGDALRCVVDDDMPADEIEIRGPHGSRRIKFGTDQTAGGADSIVRGAEFVIPPPPKSEAEPAQCEHLRSELLAEKQSAEPPFEMRKCLDCTKIFRVRKSVRTNHAL